MAEMCVGQFSIFHVLVTADTTHEANLCHNCPKAAFKSETQSEFGSNWVAILVQIK